MNCLRTMLKKRWSWSRRWMFREGKVLSRMIARDVRRVRTTNVLYLSKGLAPEPEFEPARELHIDQMWHWTGKSWGGLPDGTSIVDGLRERRSD